METGFITKKENEQEFERYWREFVTGQSLGPQYLYEFQQYLVAYSGEALVADESFVYIKAGLPVVIAFLPVEQRDGVNSITSGGSYVIAPVWVADAKNEQVVCDRIDEIASQNQCMKVMLRRDPFESDRVAYNQFIQYGYLDTSLLGYAVDCKNPDMRRNHQRAIRKIQADKAFAIEIFDAKNVTFETHEQYRELHHKCAGKVTRSKATYELQFEMIKNSNAILVGLKKDQRFIAFTSFSYLGNKALSFSAADDPEFDQLPLYHWINAAAIENLASRGIEEIDMGQPLTTSTQFLYYPDDKQKNIALFKTGFAGRYLMQFQAVKYFDKKIFFEEAEEFTKKYQIDGYEQ